MQGQTWIRRPRHGSAGPDLDQETRHGSAGPDLDQETAPRQCRARLGSGDRATAVQGQTWISRATAVQGQTWIRRPRHGSDRARPGSGDGATAVTGPDVDQETALRQ